MLTCSRAAFVRLCAAATLVALWAADVLAHTKSSVLRAASVLAVVLGFALMPLMTMVPSASASGPGAVTDPSPSTEVLLPGNGATLQGSVWLDAGASSPTGILSVGFRLFGGSINEVIATGVATRYGWISGFDSTGVPNGTYSLESELTDINGNITTSSPITVIVANKPLATTVLIPSSGASVTNGSVLDAGALGLSPVTGVNFEVTGGSLSDHVVGAAVATLYGWIALMNTTGVPPGTYVLQSVATDATETATSPGITVSVKQAYLFSRPINLAFDGTHIWVVNLGANGGSNPNDESVTELNASDGSAVQNLSGGSYGFVQPRAIAFDGTHLWVPNYSGNSITEFNASDGSWVRTLSGAPYGFNSPDGILFDGTHVWVANQGGNSVTELNASDGSFVQTLSGGSYGFGDPLDFAFDGTHLWVSNWTGDSVTELNASDGSWIQTISETATGGPPGILGPQGMVFDGTHIWVANSFYQSGVGSSVTELNASDGSFVQTVSVSTIDAPTAIAFDGTHLWVTNAGSDSVRELNASDGSIVRTLSGGSYGFDSPDAIVFDGTHLWVANIDANTVTELNASDGSWVQTLSN
jgi:hypothetical protein